MFYILVSSFNGLQPKQSRPRETKKKKPQFNLTEAFPQPLLGLALGTTVLPRVIFFVFLTATSLLGVTLQRQRHDFSVTLTNHRKSRVAWVRVTSLAKCYDVTMYTMVPLRLYVLYFGTKCKLFTQQQLTIEKNETKNII